MTDQSTLSGEEIAALMSELRDNGPRAGGSGETRPFAFGADAARPMLALPAIDRINERMAKRLRTLIEGLARLKPSVACEPTNVLPFDEWKAQQPEFISLGVYSFRPLKGPILVSMQPGLVSRLVDLFYGGSGQGTPPRAREFTPTEDRLLDRLSQSFMAALAEVWSEVVAVRPHLRSRETNVDFATVARGDEAVAVCRFVVAVGEGPSTIEIVYPVSGLRSVESELAARVHDDSIARAGDWRERLATAVGEVRVQARTVLARPELSLAELMQLRAGDVIPVSLPAKVPLLVEGKPIALGTIGEQDGRAALKIERIDKGRAA